MLIKWGAIVVDGSGKLGGHVAAKGRGGNVLWTKPRATNPQSSFQTAQRSTFAQLSQGWSSLTQAQIRGWNEAVELFRYTNAFGDLKSLSGKALYQKLNGNLLLSGQATIDDAPEPQIVNSFVFTSASISAGGGISIIGDDINATRMFMVYATPVVSQGTSYVKDQLHFIASATATATGNIGITLGWFNRFGTHDPGEKIFIAIRGVNTIGQVSPLLISQADTPV